MEIIKADKCDLSEILQVQYMAFGEEAEDFQDFSIEPQLHKAPRYEINASIRCPQNIRLYEHLDYVRFKETVTENNGFVYLEKFAKN